MDFGKIGTVVLLVLFAIFSLFVAARGGQDLPYWGGLAFFVFCVLLAFYAVANLTAPRKSHERG